MFAERNATIKTIHELDICRVDLAALAGVLPGRVTEYTSHRPLPRDRCERIERAVADIALVWGALHPYRISTSDPEIFRKAVAELRTVVHKLGATISLEEFATRTERNETGPAFLNEQNAAPAGR